MDWNLYKLHIHDPKDLCKTIVYKASQEQKHFSPTQLDLTILFYTCKIMHLWEEIHHQHYCLKSTEVTEESGKSGK